MTKDNDPWGDKPNTPQNDLGSVLGQLLGGLFGKSQSEQRPQNNGGGGQRPQRGGPQLNLGSPKLVIGGLLLVLLVWLVSGIYIVREGFSGVETLFGKHLRTNQAGIYWKLPSPLARVQQLDTQSTKTKNIDMSESSGSARGNTSSPNNAGSNVAQMLTADENIVEVSLAVHYRIVNPEEYLFRVSNPEKMLNEAAISATREVVGSNVVDYILTTGRNEWPNLVEDNLKDIMKVFNTGIEILRVELRDSKAPVAVQGAFDDAAKAREEAASFRLEAEAYRSERLPQARGEAIQVTEQAQADKARTVSKASGEAQRFSERLVTYKQYSPELTRERMYLESLRNVYSRSRNIILDTGDKMPVLYLPAGNASGAPLPLPENTSTTSSSSASNYEEFRVNIVPQKTGTPSADYVTKKELEAARKKR